MGRTLKVAAAQLGPVHLTSKREETVQRVIALLESAAAQGVQILLFPEIVFVTFFPRHLIEDQKELDKFVECDDDLIKSPNTNLLFDKAKEFGVDISVGYAERAGTKGPFPNPDAINQLEKRYFTPGNLGFKAFRVPHLVQQGKERVLDFEMNRRVETYELIMEQTGLWSRNCCNDDPNEIAAYYLSTPGKHRNEWLGISGDVQNGGVSQTFNLGNPLSV